MLGTAALVLISMMSTPGLGVPIPGSSEQGVAPAGVSPGALAVARNQADLVLGNCGGSRGSTVGIEVYFFSTAPVSAVQFDVQYGAARLIFLQAIEGPVSLASDKKISSGSPSPGVQRIIVIGANQNAMSNGLLAYLRFRITDDAAFGIIPLILAGFVASSPRGAGYGNLGTRAGSIEVTPPPVLERISPESGPPRSLVILSGINMGACQSSARVIFSGSGGYVREVIPSEATPRRVAAEVPKDATGALNVVLSVGGARTNSRTFTVDSRLPFNSSEPQIDDVNPLGTGFLPGNVHFNRRTNIVYVADVQGGAVAAIDAGKRTLVASMPVGSRPSRLAVNSSTGHVVVCSSGTNSISILAHGPAGALQNLGQVMVGRSPVGVAVNPLTNKAMVTNLEDNTVTVVDLERRAVSTTVTVGSKPLDVAMDVIRNRAYILNSGEATVSVIDMTTNRLIGTIRDVGNQPRALEFHIETGTLLVGSSSGLLACRPDGAQLFTMLQGQFISDIMLHSARGLVFGVDGASGTLFVIDLHTALVDPGRGLRSTMPISDIVITGGAVNPFANRLVLAHRSGIGTGQANQEWNSEQLASGGFSRLSLPVSLYFPRILSKPGDLLGVAVSNAGPEAAALQLTAINPAGQQLQGVEIANPYTATLPAQGQVAALDFQLFGNGTSAAGNFWFHMTSPNSSVKAFFLTGDFLSSIVGAEESGSLFTDSILPAVRQGEDNIVSVINPLPVAASVSMDLVANSGAILQSLAARVIPAYGMLQSRLDSLFSSIGQIGAGGYVRLRSTTGIRGYQQFMPVGRLDPAGLNAQSASTGPTALVFSHFVTGRDTGAVYETRAAVVNLEASSQTLTFSIRDGSGSLLASPQNQNVQASGRVEVELRGLFNLPPNARTEGWLKVEGSGRLAGYLTYSANEALAAVVSLTEPRTQLIFSQVAEEGTGYFTGLAILNTNTDTVSVSITVYSADGIPVAATEAPYLIPPNGRIVDVLNRLVQSDQVKNQRGGYVVVSASLPIHGIEIFGTSDNRAFANVPAQ